MLSVSSPLDELMPLEQEAWAVKTAFANRDALMYLVSVSRDGQVTTAINAGNDTWGEGQVSELGLSGVQGFAVGLFNQDAWVDLVIQTADGIAIAYGDGEGRFTLGTTIAAPAAGDFASATGRPVELVVGLLNDDLHADIALVAPGSDELWLLMGRGDGTFDTAQLNSGGVTPSAVVWGDFVGDARMDLAVGHVDGTVTFFAGGANGAFSLRSDATLSGLGAVQALAAGDVDGDGDLDLVVATADQVTLLLHDDAQESAVVNGDFSQGLTGWTVAGEGITASSGFVHLLEGDDFLTSIQQTLVIPAGAQTLTFDLLNVGLAGAETGIPDAFEVSLLDAQGQSLTATFQAGATSFVNFNPGESVRLAAGVTFDGMRVTLDISQLAPGTVATLFFDLVGNPPGEISSVTIDNVQLSSSQALVETFTTLALAGPFSSVSDLLLADVDGNGSLDILVADAQQAAVVVFQRDEQGTWQRESLDISPWGAGANALAAGPLTAGDTTPDVVVALAGVAGLLSPLASAADVLAPDVSLIQPTDGAVLVDSLTQMVLQFSEEMLDSGSSGAGSVSNVASYRLFAAGANGILEGGAGDDLLIEWESAVYSATTRRQMLKSWQEAGTCFWVAEVCMNMKD